MTPNTNPPRPSGRQPTPAPKVIPTISSTPPPDLEAQIDAVLGQNEQLVAQNVSLMMLLAETGMAEITRWNWADLRRMATIAYEPGSYEVALPPSDTPTPQVELRWRPGEILLCEGCQRRPDNTLTLVLPQARLPQGWRVPPPRPGQIPPYPADQPPTTSVQEQDARNAARLGHDQAWQKHCQGQAERAKRVGADQEKETAADEEKIAYAAMQLIQQRRADPKTEPGKTISAALEVMASQLRVKAGEESSPGSGNG